MAWTKVEHDLRDKPEVIAIATALQIEDRDTIVGKLIRLWQWFDKNTPNGYARGVTESFIDAHVACAGFATVLQSVGWLTVKDGAIIQPNFERHNSKSAKARALSNVRMKRSRCATSATKAQPEKRRIEKNRNSNTPIVPTASVEAFGKFWAAFPPGRKQDKQKAAKAFDEALKRTDAETIIAAAVEYAASPVGRGEFVKGPTPWLNGGCWDDDRAAWQRSENGQVQARLKVRLSDDHQ